MQHSFSMRCLTVAAAMLSACGSAPGAEELPPARPPLNVPAVSAPRVPEGPFRGIYSWNDWYEAPLGIGHLYSTEVRDYGAEWVSRIALPLHAEPEREPWGWIVQGWVVEDGEELPFDMAGMVETSYEVLSLIVVEERGEWLRFRFGGPQARDSGFAWVRLDELVLGPDSVVYQTWPDLFMSDLIGPLHFRGQEGPWPLYAQPAATEAMHRVMTRDHAIEPLEVQGEWLRVRVTEPSNYCADPERVAVTEGWLRWWTPTRGPEVWYNTRGC
jgi:hypothetical protein